ncbi:MAG: hypothetical protein GF364_21540 [Candidatus Lokiarchaeota archaeon]|nr:hypothetical protein [Candidatus Lokiarchaeota archaeon]
MIFTKIFRRVPCLGNRWTGLKNKDFISDWFLSTPYKSNLKLAAIVPGNVRQTLLENNIIKDPFLGRYNEDSKWVSTIPWIYSTKIQPAVLLKEIPVEIPKDQALHHLVFQGIDYKGEFCISGEKICEQTGMFSPVDLTTSMNVLEQHLDEKIDLDVRFAVQPFWRTHAVKCQMSFGWDFAPDLRTIGFWKGITSHFTGPAFFSEFYARIVQDNNTLATDSNKVKLPILITAKMTIIDVETLKEDKEPHIIQFEITIGKDKAQVWKRKKTILSGQRFEIKIHSADVNIWNPWSLGSPNIETINARVLFDGNLTDEYRGKVVNRHIEWLKNPGSPKNSEKWTCSINGKKIFLRGFNWVPPDSIFARISDEKYKKLVDYALEMNTDMLRIWGGGIEEKRPFYDYCDENGMLIWQEYPFACTNYPKEENYLNIVQKECSGITLRTRQHPSVVVYCGGNEFNPYINAPVINILKNSVEKEASDRHFFYVSPFRGDDHNWRYWGQRGGLESFEADGNSTFQLLSEFGMQAAPDLKTLLAVIGKDQVDDSQSIKNYTNNKQELLLKFGEVLFMNFCDECGQNLENLEDHVDNLKYCPSCGRDLTKPSDRLPKIPENRHINFFYRTLIFIIDAIICGILFHYIVEVGAKIDLNDYIPEGLLPWYGDYPEVVVGVVWTIWMSVFAILYFLIFNIALKYQTPARLIFGVVKIDRISLQKEWKIGWMILDAITKGILLFLVVDTLFGLVIKPGENNYFRLSQRLERSVVLKKEKKTTITTISRSTKDIEEETKQN